MAMGALGGAHPHCKKLPSSRVILRLGKHGEMLADDNETDIYMYIEICVIYILDNPANLP